MHNGIGQDREERPLLSHGQRFEQSSGLTWSSWAFLFMLGAAMGAVIAGSVLMVVLGLQQSGAMTEAPVWNFEQDESSVWSAPKVDSPTCKAGVPDVSSLRADRKRSSNKCCGSENSWENDPGCDYDADLVAWAMDTGGGQVDFSEVEDDYSWIPDSLLKDPQGSPWVEALEAGNRELEGAVQQLQATSGPCFKSTPLGQILDGAMKRISSEQQCSSDQPSSLGNLGIEKEVEKLLKEAAKKDPKGDPGTCKADQALADQMIVPPSPPPPLIPDDVSTLPVRERVGMCFRMYEMAEEVQLAEDIAYQIMMQEQREAMMRQTRLDWLKGIDAHRDWWKALNKTAAEAKQMYKEIKEGDPERQKLDEFLRGYLPFGDWWDSEGPEHEKSTASMQDQQRIVQDATDRLKQRTEEADRVKGRLLKECGLELPHSHWEEEQKRFLEKYQQVIDASGVEGYCIDWRTVAPEFEEQSSLHAPKKYWKKIPEVYPEWACNITFIVNWRSKDPAPVKTMWERLFKCTGGWDRDAGEIPNVLAEMLVNVFEPEATLDAWLEGWHATDKARFVVPVLPNAKGDVAAYSTLVRTAHGEVIVFLQDGDQVPETCTWIQDMLKSYSAWPRLGMTGYHTTEPSALQDSDVGAILAEWQKKDSEMEGKQLKDPENEVPMFFTGRVDSSPFSLRRTALLRLGNLDEKDPCAETASQAFMWQLCSRVWLSGYQVARLTNDAPTYPNGEQAKRNYFGRKRNAECGCYASYFQPYHKHIVKEVDRLNGLLQT